MTGDAGPAGELGTRSLLGANEPLWLVGTERAWRVVRGDIELFAVEGMSEPAMPRVHLASVGPGDVLFGIDDSHIAYRLMAVGTADSVVVEEPGTAGAAAEDRARWLHGLAEDLNATHGTSGPSGGPPLPSDPDHVLSMAIAASRERTRRRDRERVSTRAEGRGSALAGGLRALQELLAPVGVPTRAHVGESNVAAAFHAVAVAQGIRMPASRTPADAGDDIALLARSCGVTSRRVALDREWWRSDCGALVAFRSEGHHAVALLPVGVQRYRLVDPSDGTHRMVDERVAATLEPHAFALHRPFPNRPLRLSDVISLSFAETRVDVVRLVLFSAAASLLALAVPVVTGQIMAVVIPQSNRPLLLQLTIALVVAATAAALFQLATGIALLRIRGRLDRFLGPAIWSRVLAMPTAFFTKYSAGDLAFRVLSVDVGLQLISGGTAASLLGGVFSVFSFALIWFYSVELGIVATVLMVALAATLAVIGRMQVRRQREVEAAGGTVSGLTRELVSGVGKLKTSGAQERAFGVWAAAFTNKRTLRDSVRWLENLLVVIGGVFPVVSSMALFAAVGFREPPTVSPAAFLAANAAYGQVALAMLAMSRSASLVLGAVPAVQRIAPLFAQPTEDDAGGTDPGRLRGDVEFSGVSFRYRADGPFVLDDVSIRIPAGSSVAVVGPSGSGKSTLGRLLLGFERPEDGAVFFDDQDLNGLDIRAIRRQLGVVLQSADVLPGTMLSNIAGSSVGVSVDDAWRAAESAGLAEDIRAMPMGMYTTITEGGSTISGGQRQRLLIARALAGDPRVLLFDEATSALDNTTQAAVADSLARVEATRIIIAHRLSTVVAADCIYYLEHGRVVEAGTYDELMAYGGAFAAQARRQLT
ncbi:hypothetical protein GCM10028798_27110 [Humibacter antri]